MHARSVLQTITRTTQLSDRISCNIVKALKIVKENRMSARSSGMVAEDDLYVETHDLNEEITAP